MSEEIFLEEEIICKIKKLLIEEMKINRRDYVNERNEDYPTDWSEVVGYAQYKLARKVLRKIKTWEWEVTDDK